MICPGCGRAIDQRYRSCVYCGYQFSGTGQHAPRPGVQGNQQEGVPCQGTAPPPQPGTQPTGVYGQGYAPPQAYPGVQPAGQPYGQQTMQMPAQGYTGTPYGRASAYAMPQQPYPGAYAGAAPGRGSVLIGVLMLVVGAAVIASTFLPWITTPSMSVPGTSSGSFQMSTSGWSIMTRGDSADGGGFTLVATGEGAIFFSGFFSLLSGALLLVAAFIVFFRRRMGGWFGLVFAVGSTAFAAIDITMVFAKLSPLSPHAGLWVFAVMSVAALVLSIISLAGGQAADPVASGWG